MRGSPKAYHCLHWPGYFSNTLFSSFLNLFFVSALIKSTHNYCPVLDHGQPTKIPFTINHGDPRNPSLQRHISKPSTAQPSPSRNPPNTYNISIVIRLMGILHG